MVLAATPSQPSSGQRLACSTSPIDNESMALTQCPSVLSAPIIMGPYYSLNVIACDTIISSSLGLLGMRQIGR